MTETRVETEPSLAEFLSSRARHSSDARLALDVGVGVLVALIALFWRGPGWHLAASAAVCFVAYGAWGIVDRELIERPDALARNRMLLQTARVVSIVVGVCASITFILLFLKVALGRMIS